MRRMLVSLAILASLSAHTAVRADVIHFEGVARIRLDEILVHGDPYELETTTVDLEIELSGPRAASSFATAVGVARISRSDGSVTTIPLEAQMAPPEGGGGFVRAGGLGDDGATYCFRIWDQVDAPTPRPDRLVAAFEPLVRVAQGHASDNVAALEDPSGGFPLIPLDTCYPLEYRYAPPISGDFWFNTVV